MKLQIYVLWEILVNFLFTAVVLSFIAFLAAAILATYRIPGAPPSIVLGYVPILIMYIFPYLLPMSLLVGVVLTYGRLSAENEITAIRAGGIHLWSITGPSLLLGLLLAVAMLPLVNEIIPRFHYQKNEYLRDVAVKMIRNLNPAIRSIHTQSFYLEWARRRDPYFEDIYMSFKRSDKSDEIQVQADKGMLEVDGDDLVLTLWNPHTLSENKSTGLAADVSMNKMSHRIPFEEIAGSRRNLVQKEAEASTREIALKLERGVAADPDRSSYELQKRSATVFSGVLFAAIGIPIGVFMRRGTRLAAFVTAFLTVLGGYYPIVYMMETLGKEGHIHPIIAAWAANFVFSIVGVILLRKLFRI